ncbi:hypothetical protein [Roseibium sediminicola]|uniref:Response regulatory domain-containing protein n=1 Tax=Roseibium sediminicola TaxID=2933272 RepID=A0ABT0GZU8_9HYPH|nr:hypothetical protein [Roseibium sp. CAU 1639]MCK7614954.1 hypothetical protein [Roseibium sp. CAU 1639]
MNSRLFRQVEMGRKKLNIMIIDGNNEDLKLLCNEIPRYSERHRFEFRTRVASHGKAGLQIVSSLLGTPDQIDIILFDISTTRQEDLDALGRLSSIALTEKMFVFLMSNNLDDDILCIAKAKRAIAIEKKPNSQYKIDLVIDRMVSVCTEITTEAYVLDC